MVLIDGAMSFSPKEAIQGKQLWTFDQAPPPRETGWKVLRFPVTPLVN